MPTPTKKPRNPAIAIVGVGEAADRSRLLAYAHHNASITDKRPIFREIGASFAKVHAKEAERLEAAIPLAHQPAGSTPIADLLRK